jgi:hypothetical protein
LYGISELSVQEPVDEWMFSRLEDRSLRRRNEALIEILKQETLMEFKVRDGRLKLFSASTSKKKLLFKPLCLQDRTNPHGERSLLRLQNTSLEARIPA